MTMVPILEVGGSHVSAAVVAADDRPDQGEHGFEIARTRRWPLSPEADDAETILATLMTAGAWLRVPADQAWGIAVPGPFDYDTGIGRYHDVGKFDCLNGVNVGAALRAGLVPAPGPLLFLNDADAYGLGEGYAGAAVGHERFICLTLGTGVGSAFIADGRPVQDAPGIPPGGEVHLLSWADRPLEETVSTRAIRAAYEAATGSARMVHADLTVQEITDRARQGEKAAIQVLEDAMTALGRALAPSVQAFGATMIVLGGSIAGSFDLLEGALRHGLAVGRPSVDVPLRRATHLQQAPLIGAAAYVRTLTGQSRSH